MDSSDPSPNSLEPGPERGGLLFAWSGGRSLVAHLGVFLGLAFIIHLAGFYLFQVVYPVTARVEPVPSRVRVLDPTEPAVAALMRQIDDRLIFLRPSSAGSEARVSLEDFSIAFRPSFMDRGIAYRPIPLAESVDGADGFGTVLPPLNRVKLAESSLRIWRVGGPLADRAIRRPESLDEAISAFDFKGDNRVRLALAVDRGGDLRTVKPATDEEYPRIDELVIAVRTHLRFEREGGTAGQDTEADWQRGWLELGR